MQFIRRYPTQINALLTLVEGILAAIWVNAFTSTSPGVHWSVLNYQNVYLAAALLLFAAQYALLDRIVHAAPRHHLEDLLRLGAHMLLEHARQKDIRIESIRGSLHEVRRTRPMKGVQARDCLCLIARFSVYEGQDTAAIDITDSDHVNWYYNVRACKHRRGVAGDVDRRRLPETPINVPVMNKELRGIISFPILLESGDVVGAITYDSTFTARQMRWLDDSSELTPEAASIMDTLVAVIRRGFRQEWKY